LGLNSRRRVSTGGSAASQTPSDVMRWRARPGAPSARRARMAAAVRSEAWGDTAAVSGAAALLWARVQGPSAAACRFMRVTCSPNGSMTAARQLSRHCWVDEDVVNLPARAGAARAILGKRRRRNRIFHVCSRSRACSRQVSARAHVEETAMGTLRSVGMRVPRRCTRLRPATRGPASGECACAGGGRVNQGQCRQYRLGAAWPRAPLPLRGYLPASQAQPKTVGVKPGIWRGRPG